MNIRKWNGRAVQQVAVVCLWACASQAHSALVVLGPSSAVPGQSVTLSIELDATLVANIDDLKLALEFDPAVFKNPSADAGPLLASSSFLANPGAGTAVASFPATLTDLGPGVLASWKFDIDAGVVVPKQTSVRAHLQTFIIDDELTSDPSSKQLTIHIVPEPSLYAFVLVVLGALVLFPRRRPELTAKTR